MSFIGKQNVFHRHTALFQVIYDLLSFDDRDVSVIGTMQYDCGCFYLIYLIDW